MPPATGYGVKFWLQLEPLCVGDRSVVYASEERVYIHQGKFLVWTCPKVSNESIGWTNTHLGTLVKIWKSTEIICNYYKYPMLSQNQGLWVQI